VRGQTLVGNSKSLTLAGLPEEIQILDARIVQLEQKDAWKDKTITGLENHVLTLQLAGFDYRRVQNWFVSIFV